jgi:hypothetical protein
LKRFTTLFAIGLALVASFPPAIQAAPLPDASTTLVVIDTPRGGASGPQLYVSGWAADPRSPSGTGVERVEVYLDGERDAGGTFLGRATYGLARPDVAAHLGDARFAPSGYALTAQVPPGPHTVYVYALASSASAGPSWSAPVTAAVLVGPPGLAAVPDSTVVATTRLAGITGSYTYAFPGGAAYPPGPADTGGPVYAPVYWGLGLYGGVLPFPDYPLYSWAGWVPSGFDFSYGQGYDFYSPSYLAFAPYGPLGTPYVNYLRRWYPYPVYCPVYSWC